MARTRIHENSIADSAISTAKLQDDAVTDAKLADSAVTAGKIAVGGISNANQFASGVVDAVVLASDAVITAKIQDSAVSTAKIADDAVTADKLADTAVSAGAYGAVTQSLQATVDAQGRLTSLSAYSIDIPHSQVNDFDTGVQENRLDQMAVPTSALQLNSQAIEGLADGTNATDAATKGQMDTADAATLASAQSYADGLVQGIDTIYEVKAKATANVDVSSNSPATIDGESMSAGEFFLLADQTDPAENGIWEWQSAAVPTRATDFDSITEVEAKPFVYVQNGTSYGSTGWMLAGDMTGATIGTDPMEFRQFSGAGQTVGDGSTTDRSGNQIYVKAGGISSNELATDSVTTDAIANGAVVNDKLANADISFGGVSLDLGQSDATPAFDLTDATNYPFSSLTGQAAANQIGSDILDPSHLSSTLLAQLGPDQIGHYEATGAKGYVDFNGTEAADFGSFAIMDTTPVRWWVHRDGILQRETDDFTLGDNGSDKLRVTLTEDLATGEVLSVRRRDTQYD